MPSLLPFFAIPTKLNHFFPLGHEHGDFWALVYPITNADTLVMGTRGWRLVMGETGVWPVLMAVQGKN